jgi:Fibrinogen beta and gamma chains, C-terminal globular domain
VEFTTLAPDESQTLKEEIFISNIASTQRKERHGRLFRNVITFIRLRISTGRGTIIKTDLEIFRGISGLEMISFTSKLYVCCFPKILFKTNLLLFDRLTTENNMVLRIILEDFQDNHVWVEYNSFKIESEKLKYNLLVDEYRGSIADSFLYHNNQTFSTFDMTSDKTSSCAKSMASGWWFKK